MYQVNKVNNRALKSVLLTICALFLLFPLSGCLASLTPAQQPAEAQAAQSALEAERRARIATEQLNQQQQQREHQAERLGGPRRP
jgi:hypothetical protein